MPSSARHDPIDVEAIAGDEEPAPVHESSVQQGTVPSVFIQPKEARVIITSSSKTARAPFAQPSTRPQRVDTTGTTAFQPSGAPVASSPPFILSSSSSQVPPASRASPTAIRPQDPTMKEKSRSAQQQQQQPPPWLRNGGATNFIAGDSWAPNNSDVAEYHPSTGGRNTRGGGRGGGDFQHGGKTAFPTGQKSAPRRSGNAYGGAWSTGPSESGAGRALGGSSTSQPYGNTYGPAKLNTSANPAHKVYPAPPSRRLSSGGQGFSGQGQRLGGTAPAAPAAPAATTSHYFLSEAEQAGSRASDAARNASQSRSMRSSATTAASRPTPSGGAGRLSGPFPITVDDDDEVSIEINSRAAKGKGKQRESDFRQDDVLGNDELDLLPPRDPPRHYGSGARAPLNLAAANSAESQAGSSKPSRGRAAAMQPKSQAKAQRTISIRGKATRATANSRRITPDSEDAVTVPVDGDDSSDDFSSSETNRPGGGTRSRGGAAPMVVADLEGIALIDGSRDAQELSDDPSKTRRYRRLDGKLMSLTVTTTNLLIGYVKGSSSSVDVAQLDLASITKAQKGSDLNTFAYLDVCVPVAKVKCEGTPQLAEICSGLASNGTLRIACFPKNGAGTQLDNASELISKKLKQKASKKKSQPGMGLLSAQGQRALWDAWESTTEDIELFESRKGARAAAPSSKNAAGKPRPSADGKANQARLSDMLRSDASSSRAATRSQGPSSARASDEPQTTRRSSRVAAAKAGRASSERAISPTPPNKVLLNYPQEGTGSITITHADSKRLQEGEFLNDTLVEFGLKRTAIELANSGSPVAPHIHIFSSFFYKKLSVKKTSKLDDPYATVRKWTQKVDIFSKDFLVVPINEYLHWYLAIICNPGALLRSHKTSEPLHMTRHAAAELDNTTSASAINVEDEAEEERQAEETRALTELKTQQGIDVDASEDEEERKEESHRSAMTEAFAETQAGAIDAEQGAATREPSPASDKGEAMDLDAPQMSASTSAAPADESISAGPRDYMKNVPHDTCYIFTFDSLGGTHKAVGKKLAQYLVREAGDKKGKDDATADCVKVVKAAVPLQGNYSDCGLYLLHYVETVLKNPPMLLDVLLNTPQVAKGSSSASSVAVHEAWNADLARTKRKQVRELVEDLAQQYREYREPLDRAAEEDRKRREQKRQEKRKQHALVNGVDPDKAEEQHQTSKQAAMPPPPAVKGRGRSKKNAAPAIISISDSEDDESEPPTPQKPDPAAVAVATPVARASSPTPGQDRSRDGVVDSDFDQFEDANMETASVSEDSDTNAKTVKRSEKRATSTASAPPARVSDEETSEASPLTEQSASSATPDVPQGEDDGEFGRATAFGSSSRPRRQAGKAAADAPRSSQGGKDGSEDAQESMDALSISETTTPSQGKHKRWSDGDRNDVAASSQDYVRHTIRAARSLDSEGVAPNSLSADVSMDVDSPAPVAGPAAPVSTSPHSAKSRQQTGKSGKHYQVIMDHESESDEDAEGEDEDAEGEIDEVSPPPLPSSPPRKWAAWRGGGDEKVDPPVDDAFSASLDVEASSSPSRTQRRSVTDSAALAPPTATASASQQQQPSSGDQTSAVEEIGDSQGSESNLIMPSAAQSTPSGKAKRERAGSESDSSVEVVNRSSPNGTNGAPSSKKLRRDSPGKGKKGKGKARGKGKTRSPGTNIAIEVSSSYHGSSSRDV